MIHLMRAGAVALAVAAFVGCDRRAVRPEATAEAAMPAPAAAAPCPSEMALVVFDGGRVCVDRYEAAIEGRSFSQPPDARDAGPMRAVPAKGLKPQVNISGSQSEAACAGSSKRLCSAREWTAACRGPSKQLYPYGNEHVAGACNEGHPSPVPSVLGGGALGKLDDPRLAEAPNGIQVGGGSPGCVTAVGIFDMHGNVHEWVSDSSKADDPRFGMFLGGFFADASENGAGCTYRTTAHLKEYHDYSTGFRCCKDAN